MTVCPLYSESAHRLALVQQGATLEFTDQRILSMSDLLAARAQMGTSLAFHIIFSALGVGLPLLLCIAEGLALHYKDPIWMLLTRRWARAAAILFAIGAVSGTILSFELGLLWPTYTKFAGSGVGLPFALEGFALFLEALCLGLYLHGLVRISG